MHVLKQTAEYKRNDLFYAEDKADYRKIAKKHHLKLSIKVNPLTHRLVTIHIIDGKDTININSVIPADTYTKYKKFLKDLSKYQDTASKVGFKLNRFGRPIKASDLSAVETAGVGDKDYLKIVSLLEKSPKLNQALISMPSEARLAVAYMYGVGEGYRFLNGLLGSVGTLSKFAEWYIKQDSFKKSKSLANRGIKGKGVKEAVMQGINDVERVIKMSGSYVIQLGKVVAVASDTPLWKGKLKNKTDVSDKDMNKFINYLMDFYSTDHGIYPIKGLNEAMILIATTYFLKSIEGNSERTFEGDTIDRESVRDVLEELGYGKP